MSSSHLTFDKDIRRRRERLAATARPGRHGLIPAPAVDRWVEPAA